MKPVCLSAALVLALAGCAGSSTPTSEPTTTAAGPTQSATAGATPTRTASKACTDLAAAVKVAHLGSGTPTAAVAEQVAESLDDRLPHLPASVHDHAVDLHGNLHDLARALRKHRTVRAAELADKAKAAARAAAQACGLADRDFLGQP